MTELRDKIAGEIDAWLEAHDGCEVDCGAIADNILAIPEIVEAVKMDDHDLARLLKLAAAGHEGVDLGQLSEEELDKWIKRH